MTEPRKTQTMAIRISPEDRRLLDRLAAEDCRSASAEIIWLLRREAAAREGRGSQ